MPGMQLDKTGNYPELKQYHNGWLTNQLINQALTSSRNQAKKKLKAGGVVPLRITNDFAPQTTPLQTRGRGGQRQTSGM
jgi:hypothetical protein